MLRTFIHTFLALLLTQFFDTYQLSLRKDYKVDKQPKLIIKTSMQLCTYIASFYDMYVRDPYVFL